MNQNPLLLATLFMKHQPAAKSFEEAVAMEVESLKAEWAAIDNELNALAAKERELSARKHQLMDTRRELLGDDKADVAPAHTPAPEKPAVGLAPSLLRFAARTSDENPDQAPMPPITLDEEGPVNMRTGTSSEWRKRAKTGEFERKYDSYTYANVAQRLGVGTRERGGVVWLTPEEWGVVYPAYKARKADRQQQGKTRKYGGRAAKVCRARTNGENEYPFTGSDYVRYAQTEGKGTPGIGCVWLSDSEADAANVQAAKRKKG